MRYLNASERALSRNLWEEAFPEDSKAFTDYYFSEKIKDNEILVLEEDGRIDAMLQRNPYTLQVKNEQWTVDYLVGVATRKTRRHRGYMSRLLEKMMDDMRNEHMPFCFLMPADEAIYRPFGFTFVFDQPYMEWREEGKLTKRTVQSEKMLKQLILWMEQWLAAHAQVYAVRSSEYLKRLTAELASEQGTLQMVFDGERLIGAESFWGLDERVLRLRYGEDSYVREMKPSKPAIMARIMDAECFMSVISLRTEITEAERTILLRLTDPLIKANDGLWNWTLTKTNSWIERAADQNAEAELTLTITELTAWLFGYEVPQHASAFHHVVQPLKGVFLDEVV